MDPDQKFTHRQQAILDCIMNPDSAPYDMDDISELSSDFTADISFWFFYDNYPCCPFLLCAILNRDDLAEAMLYALPESYHSMSNHDSDVEYFQDFVPDSDSDTEHETFPSSTIDDFMVEWIDEYIYYASCYRDIDDISDFFCERSNDIRRDNQRLFYLALSTAELPIIKFCCEQGALVINACIDLTSKSSVKQYLTTMISKPNLYRVPKLYDCAVDAVKASDLALPEPDTVPENVYKSIESYSVASTVPTYHWNVTVREGNIRTKRRR